MPDESLTEVQRRERRGLDPAILAFLHRLLGDYDENHRREHEALIRTYRDALTLAAERLEDLDKSTRERYDLILAERDARYGERFSASQSALAEAAASAQEAVRTALRTAREETNKTEANWVKTADATFVKIEQLQSAFAKAVPREESDKIQKEQDRRMGEIDRRITILEAAKIGKAESQVDLRGWIVALVAFVGLAVTIAVAFGSRTP